MSANRKSRALWTAGVALVLAGGAAFSVGYFFAVSRTDAPEDPGTQLARQVHTACAACHAYPPPDSFPRSAWAKEVAQGYAFAGESRPDLVLPPIRQTIDYFESRAPGRLPVPAIRYADTPCPVRFEKVGDGQGGSHAVSNVNLVRLFDDRHTELLACDMRANEVRLLRPYQSSSAWEVLARLPHPVHTEVVDLDGDGVKDIVVACLGEFLPTDRLCGSVVWLRGDKSGRFTPFTLLEGVGRVADVRAADFDGDGKTDLVVAVFGWRHVGNILLLENRTADGSRPEFRPKEIDDRHGTINVPVADLNGDGRPDFVALISQEHETVVAFLNTGDGFRKETVWAAPHPAYGSSGIELVDMDGDGDLDVLYTNGDAVDNNLLRPDHGVQWLENRGGFPFVHHPLAPMYGAHRAVAADFDGDGDLDVVAVSFLPRRVFPEQKNIDSIVLLEQVGPGRFVRHALERGSCDHVTCAAGDLFGEGRVDFVTGNFALFESTADSLTFWRNRGKRNGSRPAR